MVRAVKTKAVRSLNKGEQALLLPGSTGAEPWEVWFLGGQKGAECIRTCAAPRDNRLRKNAILALPVCQVYCLPLWLNETDAKLFPGIIQLQLELRGLQPRGGEPAIFDFSVVAQEGTRTLVSVGVLPATLPPEIQSETYENFDLSARCFPLPENALTIWKEQDRLVVAITRGPALVYFQALTEGQLTTRVLQDLSCVYATLTMQGVLVSIQQVVLWTEASATEVVALRTALQVPIQPSECPPPRVPSPIWKLTPHTVNAAKKNKEVAKWRNRGIGIAFVIYLCLVVWMISKFFVTSQKVNELRKWQTAHAPALAQVRQTQAIWKELQPVVDEKDYPLELLFYASAAIPQDQLHLTLFEAGGGHIRMKGEAKNVAAAFKFLDNLNKDPHFTGYSLNMGSPQLMSNDLARFQIEGSHAY